MADRFNTIVHDWDAEEAESYFRYAGYRARNASEPLREAGRELRRRVDRAFATQGGSDGDPWQDLKKSYKPRKQRTYGHTYPILHGRGGLRDKATLPSTTKTSSSAEGGYLIYSVNHPHAEWQSTEQTITGQKKDGKQSTYIKPARPFVVLTEEYQEEVEGMFSDWLDDIRDANPARSGADVSPFRGFSAWL